MFHFGVRPISAIARYQDHGELFEFREILTLRILPWHVLFQVPYS